MAPDVVIQNESTSKSYSKNIKYAPNNPLIKKKNLNTGNRAFIVYDYLKHWLQARREVKN